MMKNTHHGFSLFIIFITTVLFLVPSSKVFASGDSGPQPVLSHDNGTTEDREDENTNLQECLNEQSNCEDACETARERSQASLTPTNTNRHGGFINLSNAQAQAMIQMTYNSCMTNCITEFNACYTN